MRNLQNRVKILIVEDQMITALDLKKQLSDKFEIVGIVTSGLEALRITKQTQPDIIVMDIMINGKLNGIETAALIRKEFNIPVIFLTALSDDETYLEAKIVSPYKYITKPFKHFELIEIIQHIVKN